MSFYRKTGPKSLGIEFVNSKVLPLIEKFSLKPEDVLITYIEHISDQLNRSISGFSKNKMLVTGGGTYNKTLIDSIKRKVKCELVVPEKKIIDLLNTIYKSKLLNDNGIIIIHRHKKEEDEFPNEFNLIIKKNYGISKIIFGNYF